MRTKKYNNKKKHILLSIGLISLCIITLIIIYITKSKELFSNKKKFLYETKYKCNESHLIPAFNPELCCVMKNGKLKCDYKKNCKCKNRHTGICETCYPKIKIKRT